MLLCFFCGTQKQQQGRKHSMLGKPNHTLNSLSHSPDRCCPPACVSAAGCLCPCITPASLQCTTPATPPTNHTLSPPTSSMSPTITQSHYRMCVHCHTCISQSRGPPSPCLGLMAVPKLLHNHTITLSHYHTCILKKIAPKMTALLRLLIRRAMEAALSREIWRQLRCSSSLNCLRTGQQTRDTGLLVSVALQPPVLFSMQTKEAANFQTKPLPRQRRCCCSHSKKKPDELTWPNQPQVQS